MSARARFKFQGTGRCAAVNLPTVLEDSQIQWAPKVSYQLENMLQLARNLKQISPVFPNEMRIIR